MEMRCYTLEAEFIDRWSGMQISTYLDPGSHEDRVTSKDARGQHLNANPVSSFSFQERLRYGKLPALSLIPNNN
jgi:hypothetical protein